MRSRHVRRYKKMTALQGIDLSDVLDTVSTVANTAGSIYNAVTGPSTTTIYSPAVNPSYPTTTAPAAAPQQDNTWMYVGLGFLGLLTLGGITYAVTRPSDKKK